MASTLQVLVVDDDRDVADVIARMLEARGYRCIIAAGGASMREALADDGFGAVILDALMPGEPSVTLAVRAKELRLPVVMISGSDEMMKFAQEHNLQLLQKPFRMTDLYAALDTALASGEFGQRGLPDQE
jgi:DNA-binding NtrC family response regulator